MTKSLIFKKNKNLILAAAFLLANFAAQVMFLMFSNYTENIYLIVLLFPALSIYFSIKDIKNKNNLFGNFCLVIINVVIAAVFLLVNVIFSALS